MPYIPPIARDELRLDWRDVETPGELNHQISVLLHTWLNTRGLTYKNLNAAIGALECAKLELYRQVAAPYEDKKKEEHGSVSGLDGGD